MQLFDEQPPEEGCTVQGNIEMAIFNKLIWDKLNKLLQMKRREILIIY